jgi:predicted ATPase
MLAPLASLLSLPIPDDVDPLPEDPDALRRRTFDTLVTWFLRLADRQPVVLVLEDLHWSDPSTLELLGRILEQRAATTLLCLATHRPEFLPGWPARSHVSQLSLGPLTRRQTEEMVRVAAGERALDPRMIKGVLERADGNPLYVEELVKMLQETRRLDEQGEDGIAIPRTLHDLLMARLDRLESAKMVAQVGAVLGREFPYRLLASVWDRGWEALAGDLRRLVEAELLYQRGSLPDAVFQFKHALIQDAAYQSLLRRQRREIHARVARALEAGADGVAEPALLARHWREAGVDDKAVACYRDAASAAQRRSAHAEGAEHLSAALACLGAAASLGDRERKQLERELQNKMGVCLTALNWADPRRQPALERVVALCDELGDDTGLFPALFGLSQFHLNQGRHVTAHQIATRLRQSALQAGDEAQILAADVNLGEISWWMGDFARSRELFESVLQRYDPARHAALALEFGIDPAIHVCLFLGWLLVIQGLPDRAIELVDRTSELAEHTAHPYGAWLGRYIARAHVLQCRGEIDTLEELTAAAIESGDRQGFEELTSWFKTMHGWAIAKRGRPAEGVGELQKAIARADELSTRLSRTWQLTMLGEACLAANRLDLAESAVLEACTRVEESSERFYEAEVHRVAGEVAIAQKKPEEAEACFSEAREIARRAGALWWELRAVTSRTRHFPGEASRLELAEAYGRFSEGFAAPHMMEARRLLEQRAADQ